MRKGFRLQSLVYSLVIYLLLPIAYNLSPVHAADSTPSADPLRQSASEASIRTKLEEFKKEIASKAAKLKQQVNRKLKDKAYTGKIKSKSNTAITLASDSSAKLISINQDTVFETKIKTKTKFSQKSLKEEDFIAALGDIDEVGVLTAKKIILIPDPAEEKIYLWGQILSVSDNLVTIKTNNSQNTAASLKDISQLKLNDFIILTGIKDKSEIFKAGFIYVIPQGGIIKPKKSATPSALLKATTSAKISSPSGNPKLKR